MLRLLCVLLLTGLCGLTAEAADSVKLEKKGDAIEITIGGKPFTTYNIAKSQPKPYFWPVLAADGAKITRDLEKPEDHPHHKGIWCAIDEINGLKFWAEKAKIENASVELTQAEGNPARFKAVNHWVGTDGKPALKETVTVSIYANRRIDYDLQFTAGSQAVTFGDTKEGLFGIRLPNTMRGSAGGRISNAEGLKEEVECWGKESKWVDYVGEVNEKTYGVAIFDDPRNFRKSRFHVRNYGLFSVSPFGQSAYTNAKFPADPLTLQPGMSVRLRYGLYLHEGDTTQGQVAATYEEFVKSDTTP